VVNLTRSDDNDNYLDVSFFYTDPTPGPEDLEIRGQIRNTASGGGVIIAKTGANLNQIYSIVSVYTSATDRELFVDGVSEGTSTASHVWPASLDRISVGANRRSAPFGYSDNDIYECGVSDVAWTEGDAIMFAAGVPGNRIRPDSNTTYYPLWGTSPEPDIAQAGNKHDLTVTGATAIVDSGTMVRYAPFAGFNQASAFVSAGGGIGPLAFQNLVRGNQ
jgi:hypothetical protein